MKGIQIMNSFIYDIPTKVYFGPNQLGNLGKELAAYGKKVLLCYGGGSIKKSGLYARVAAQLKEAGLDRIHSGFETGSDAVLQKINKGVTQQQEITAGKNIKAGGIELSVYFMPGVGGKELTKENAEGTSHVINEI